MYTRNVNKVYLDFEDTGTLLMVEEIKKIYDSNQWIEFENSDIVFNKSCNLFMLNLTKHSSYVSYSGEWPEKIVTDVEKTYNDLQFTSISRNQALTLFCDSDDNPFISDSKVICKNSASDWIIFKEDDGDYKYFSINSKSEGRDGWGIVVPVYNLESRNFLDNILKFRLIPKNLNQSSKEKLSYLLNFSDYIGADGDYNVICKYSDGAAPLKIDDDEKLLRFFAKPYLECDYLRADIEPYDLRCLTDINGGHWDLWSEKEADDKTMIEIEPAFVGRNPEADIRWDGLVGIDFGTRSTVVSYQDGTDKTYLHRIGAGKLSKRAEARHYENPTVMEFVDFDKFMERYNAAEGRPETLWNELTVSHTAQNNFIDSKDSSHFYSYFYDLKQWCGDISSGRQIKIKDQHGNEKILPAFVQLDKDDFDPIEIYAYYLGLYINNMRNGIFLDYLMSFPVTYEKKVREKILISFERGLKKSLPVEILENDEIMSHFRVQSGASEPACYAICALQQFNVEPIEDEKIFYSIFDFGGGTTDFDFGIWRLADENEPEEEDYDYVIEHFGAGGDQYLGGENLLELMSYEIFKNNTDVLLASKGDDKTTDSVGFTFSKPAECEVFDGHESLVAKSQEARRNTKKLTEKLRPFLEGLELRDEKIVPPADFAKNGCVEVNLFDKEGKMKTSVQLKVDTDELIDILYKRIEKGVSNFFHALKTNFEKCQSDEIKFAYIFLAGNSSKSPIVKMIFNTYMEKYAEMICEKYNLDKNNFFIMFAPLGTPEADDQQRENGVEIDEKCITRPTGKTGVAYGLLDGRKGSNILVKSEVDSKDEIPFNFYVGINRKKVFKTILPKGTEYNKWIRLKNALTTDFYLYYSNLPVVESDATPIDDIRKKKCILPEEFGKEYSVYIRAVKPSVIEYTVSDEEGISNDDYMFEPQKVELTL